jgi:hypothetical protein
MTHTNYTTCEEYDVFLLGVIIIETEYTLYCGRTISMESRSKPEPEAREITQQISKEFACIGEMSFFTASLAF